MAARTSDLPRVDTGQGPGRLLHAIIAVGASLGAAGCYLGHGRGDRQADDPSATPGAGTPPDVAVNPFANPRAPGSPTLPSMAPTAPVIDPASTGPCGIGGRLFAGAATVDDAGRCPDPPARCVAGEQSYCPCCWLMPIAIT